MVLVAHTEVTVPGTEKPLMERREAPHTGNGVRT
jgi:hypothetical protein